MKPKPWAIGFLLIAIVGCTGGCGSRPSRQPFDKAKWNDGRKTNPELNACPSMLGDLMTNHLFIGMQLEEVTNLLGSAEIKTPVGAGVHIRGEFIDQIVYVYLPGLHNGWMIQGTNSLILWFGHKGKSLKEWSPNFPVVKPVSAVESEAARDARESGGLHVGNLHFASTPSQFEALLGLPDGKRTEYQLDYFLGKRARFAWDEVFLELHFDASNRLSRFTWSEH